MRFHIDQPPRARDRRVIRRLLVQSYPQKTAQRQRIRRPPRDPPLALDPFEVPDQQQTKIPSRHQRRTPHPLRIETRTLPLHKLIKPALLQHSVQLFVERMCHRSRQFRVRDPEWLLLSLLGSSPHGHAWSLRTIVVDRRKQFFSGIQTFTTDCYGHSATETLVATPWKEFLATL
jgi:hypothetical protein